MAANMREVICNYCKKSAELVTGADIYPHRRDLTHRKLWQCKPCDAYVGCHEGTEKPYGSLANKETREARMLAHSEFDKLWLLSPNRHKARSAAYAWLSDQMLSHTLVHISGMTADQCYEVIDLLKKKKPTELTIFAWATRNQGSNGTDEKAPVTITG